MATLQNSGITFLHSLAWKAYLFNKYTYMWNSGPFSDAHVIENSKGAAYEKTKKYKGKVKLLEGVGSDAGLNVNDESPTAAVE
ncbi:hypothetical protein HPP92_028861 [Vanilla planifolia]|uniref:Uncharacterized protein n=1 Tax=Vanilla planifolia TaxID=51239 RepID=A0A835P4H3_VANPL|nr:hypothetical protein HPP92_028861 [Vanilla planifolia]